MKKRVFVVCLMLVVLFAGCGKETGKKTDDVVQETEQKEPEATVTPEQEEVGRFGITIKEEFHGFDAKTGITDFQKIENKVYVCRNALDVRYYEEGSKEPQDFVVEKELEFGEDEWDFVTAFWVNRYRVKRTEDGTIESTVFRINRDYRTEDGLCEESTYAEALEHGYRPYMQTEAIRVFDCNGEADWEEAERLAEQAMQENSFACLKHIEDSFCAAMGDIYKMHYMSDDVEAFMGQLDWGYNQPAKDMLIGMIALAMEVQKIQTGEIDCFVMYAVSFYNEEQKGFLPLEIHVFTKKENIEQWDESWGVNIQ